MSTDTYFYVVSDYFSFFFFFSSRRRHTRLQGDWSSDVCSSDLTVAALRQAFASDLADQQVEHITVDPNIAIVAAVGENMRGTPGIAGRTFSTLGREGVNIIAIAQGSSEYNISFVVDVSAMQRAVAAVHKEFRLDERDLREENEAATYAEVGDGRRDDENRR